MAKLEVGDVNDPLEREADAVADLVMRMPVPSRGASDGLAPETDAALDDDSASMELSDAPMAGAFGGAGSLPEGPGFVARRRCASCESEGQEDEIHRSGADALVAGERDTCEDEAEIRRACWSCDAKEDTPIRRSPAVGSRRFGGRLGGELWGPAPMLKVNEGSPFFGNFLRERGAPTPESAFAYDRHRAFVEASVCDDRPRYAALEWLLSGTYQTSGDESEIRRACAGCDVVGDDEIHREAAGGWRGGPTSGKFAAQLRSRPQAHEIVQRRWDLEERGDQFLEQAEPTDETQESLIGRRGRQTTTLGTRRLSSLNIRPRDPGSIFPRDKVELTHRLRPIHPKLEVGSANDPLEHEADGITDEVPGMSAPTTDGHSFAGERALSGAPSVVARRECASCDVEVLRREPGAGQRGGPASDGFAGRVRTSARLGGSALSSGVRNFLEPRLGVGLGGIRIHSDATAGVLARQINARAFTLGQDIFFARGELRPQTQSGMRLIAHEVAHTLQAASSSLEVRRAPPESSGTESPATAQLDYGEDFLEQDEKVQTLVRLTRHHLLNMIRDLMRPGETDISEDGEEPVIETFSSTLDYFDVPANLKNAAKSASKRFVLITEYLDGSSDRSAVLMSQWLDAAETLIDKLSACVRWIAKNGDEVGELIGDMHSRRLRILDRRVQKLRKLAFFQEGAKLEEIAREVETAEKIEQIQNVLDEQIEHLRRETRIIWMSVPEEELRVKLDRLQLELIQKRGELFVGGAAEQSQAKWNIRVVETKIQVLSELLGELNFVTGPTITERAQALAKTVNRDLGHGAKRLAALIEQAVASDPTDLSALETVIDTFRWVEFDDDATTKTERLANEVLSALKDPAATLAALVEHERGQIIIGWLSPERRPELKFTLLVVWADPGYYGESRRPPLVATSYLKGLGEAGRPYAVMNATSMLAKSGSLDRYAAFADTRHLLVEMAYQLWIDGYSKKFVSTGDALADAVATSGRGGPSVPIVDGIHVEREPGGDDLIVSMPLWDYTEAVDVLGADGETAGAMFVEGGLRIRPTEAVVLLTKEGRVSAPALKLLEIGAKADRGLIKATVQDFASWSADTSKSVSEGIERRAAARLEWLEGLVDRSADGARALAGEYLDGENLRRVESVIGALEVAGEGMVVVVAAAEGLRVGVQTAAVNTAGGLGEIGGNLVAGAAELGSDVFEGRALSDFTIEYDYFDHKVRVTVDAAPEIASGLYDAAVAKLESADGFEKVFIVSKIGGQIVFEVGISLVGVGATKVGKADELADLGRLADAADSLHDADRAVDVARLSEKAADLADQGLVRTADHLDAIEHRPSARSKVAGGVHPTQAKAVELDTKGPIRNYLITQCCCRAAQACNSNRRGNRHGGWRASPSRHRRS